MGNLQVFGVEAIEWLTEIFNVILKTAKMSQMENL